MEEREFFVTYFKKKCPSPCDFFAGENRQCLHDKQCSIQGARLYENCSTLKIPATCSVSDCPIPKWEPYARLFVGKLTEEEKTAVEKQMALADVLLLPFRYDLHIRDASEPENEHDRLTLKFDLDNEHAEKHGNSGTYIDTMLRYVKAAKKVREKFRGVCESSTPEQSAVVESTNELPSPNDINPSADAVYVAEHIKRLSNYREPSKNLHDVKPPQDENAGIWVPFEKALPILCDGLQNNRTRKQQIKHLADRRSRDRRSQDTMRVLDEESGYIHGKDKKGVFFRYPASQKMKPIPEYFILFDNNRLFADDYPHLPDGFTPPDIPPSEGRKGQGKPRKTFPPIH